MKATDFIGKMTTRGVAYVGSGIEEVKASLIIEALSKNHNLIIVGYKGEEDLKEKTLKVIIEDYKKSFEPEPLKIEAFENPIIKSINTHKRSKPEKNKNWWKVIGKNVKK